MPLTIKRTNSTSIAANSVLFNGTSQYLSIPNNAAFNLSGAFTMECWIYFTSTPTLNASSVPGVTMARYGITGNTNQGWEFDINFNGSISIAKTGSGNGFGANCSAFSLNTWYHVAAVYNGSAGTIYLNGTALTSTNNTWSWTAPSGGTPLMTIGALLLYAGYNNYFPGYVSNFRIVKGTAVYTSNFTPPTSPLTAIANTSLLTCNAPTIVDSSTNNFTITNNGSATVSSVSPTFLVLTTNNFQFARRASTLSGKSVQFDGTNDYLSLADSANLRIGTSAFCIEAWIYLNTLPDKSIIFGKRTYNTTGTGTYLFRVDSAGNLLLQELQNVTTIVNASAAIQINTWYHVAVSRDSSNNVRLFVNGTVVSTATSTFNFSSTEPLWIGKDNAAVQLLLNGYISNLRFVIGNPVYTSSFTPPTAPLTAIANTALLTCNAATIVDSSTNNFTITNNNGATVSSVSPFVASGGGMSLKKVYADPVVFMGTQKAIFGYGNYSNTEYSMTNLVSNTGVVATDTAGVGSARRQLAAAGYGADKAIFGYGRNSGNYYSLTNLVSNTGVVATDTTGVGTGRYSLAATGYGTDKAIFGYGDIVAAQSMTNLVSNTGVVATDTTGVGTARSLLAAAGYGTDKAIFGYGFTTVRVSITNLVSNTGVVATDTTGVGTARDSIAAAGYGTDKAIFGYGYIPSYSSITNLVSNTGVVSTDTTGVGTVRYLLAAAGYGTDKAIFGYGWNGSRISMTNLVSNTGVVATDTTGVGTGRYELAAAGFSLT